MTLVDTSVWINHLRERDERLLSLVDQEMVLLHPFVLGEIALGTLSGRERVLAGLRKLGAPILAEHDLVMDLIECERLYGSGLGYVDAHLLVSTLLTPDAQLWTRDRRLLAAAERLGVAA